MKSRIFKTIVSSYPLVEQELLTIPEHMSSRPVFNGIRVTRSLVLCVCFVDRCLSFCTFSFGHCVVCPFVLFLLVIVLSVLFRYTDSDYPFGIFKLFLQYLTVPICNDVDFLALDRGAG